MGTRIAWRLVVGGASDMNVTGRNRTKAGELLLRTREEEIVLLLLILLIILMFAVTPAWPYSRGWGYYPSSGLGLIVLVLVILLLMGRI